MVVNNDKNVYMDYKLPCKLDVNSMLIRTYEVVGSVTGNLFFDSNCIITEDFILQKDAVIDGDVIIDCRVIHGNVIIKGKITGNLIISNIAHGGVVIESTGEVNNLIVKKITLEHHNINEKGKFKLNGKINGEITIHGEILGVDSKGVLQNMKAKFKVGEIAYVHVLREESSKYAYVSDSREYSALESFHDIAQKRIYQVTESPEGGFNYNYGNVCEDSFYVGPQPVDGILMKLDEIAVYVKAKIESDHRSKKEDMKKELKDFNTSVNRYRKEYEDLVDNK